MISQKTILEWLEQVPDPEVPVLSVVDLGIIREIHISTPDQVEVIITPTYSGCPAMHMIAMNIKGELMARGIASVSVKETLSPAWTTDWMSETGKAKLKAYGIAPPQYRIDKDPGTIGAIVPCPQCGSKHTTCISEFGSTACKALFRCQDCLEPFDYFKCH